MPAADALRTLGRSLLDDVDAIADRLTLMIVHREPSYCELGIDLRHDLQRTCRANLERGLQTFSGVIPDGVDPTDTSRETGRLRAQQGVPLESVLRAYRLGGRVLWEALREASRERFGGAYDEALLDAASFVWKVNDASASAVVDAYRQEEHRALSRDLSRRHAYLDALLEGRGGDPALAREAGVVLGLPENGRLLCVAAPLDLPGDEPLRAPQELLDGQEIVSCWYTRPHDVVGLIALGNRSTGAITEVLEPGVLGRVGVSPEFDGLAEVGAAYRMAHTAARTLRAPGLAVYDDRLPEVLLADSPELMPRMLRVSMGELLELPEPDRQTLLDTLDTVLACGGSPTRAARALYCHRNTVIYRLQRIESATGRRIAEPRDRLLLTLGLMAARAR